MISEAVVAENNKSPSRVTDEELNEWTRLASAATPGPWLACSEAANKHRFLVLQGDDEENGFWVAQCTFDRDFDGHNARLIAAARTAVPKLLLEVAQLRHELDKALIKLSGLECKP